MPAEVKGIVFRSKDKSVTAQFYADLGLGMQDHEHGGPRHFGVLPISPTFVLEIYQASEAYDVDAILLNVDSISEALLVAKKYGIEPITELRVVGNLQSVYIKDPDGRAVMLLGGR